MLNDFITEYSIEGVDHKIDIEKALQKLDQREREILSLHLYGYSNKEISKKTNYSQSQVSRILVNIANESSLHIFTC